MADLQSYANLFKVLSDPTRLHLIKLLGEQPADCCEHACSGQHFMCVNALAHELNVTQSAVSQHLRVLRQAELVSSTRHGSFMHYTLNKEGLEQAKTALVGILDLGSA